MGELIISVRWLDLVPETSYVKVAPWDDIEFGFQFCNEVVSPADHDLGFLKMFGFKKKHILSTFIRIQRKPKKLFAHLKDGYMLAKHWATCWCRRPSAG